MQALTIKNITFNGCLLTTEIPKVSIGIMMYFKYFNCYDYYDLFSCSRNIYIQTEESSDFRDIYLAPFDSRLILCVLMTGIMFSIALTIINKISQLYRATELNQNSGGFIEYLVWSVGVFSQQGKYSFDFSNISLFNIRTQCNVKDTEYLQWETV